MYEKLAVYTDGASRNNPGEAGLGVVIKNPAGETLQTASEYLGVTTNNVAEYMALIRGLETIRPMKPKAVDFYLDSQLVVRQMQGIYKIKNRGLMPLAKKAQALCRQLTQAQVRFHHIPREKNHEADALANEAIDLRA
ncbi:MAG: ribonuclease HI family protein [Nitrospiria bacterium]